jgi:hypothetical protein
VHSTSISTEHDLRSAGVEYQQMLLVKWSGVLRKWLYNILDIFRIIYRRDNVSFACRRQPRQVYHRGDLHRKNNPVPLYILVLMDSRSSLDGVMLPFFSSLAGGTY